MALDSRLAGVFAWMVVLVGARPLWSSPLAITAVGSEEGLPHPAVVSLAQTPDRALWVATHGGVCRWDGHTCVAPTLAPGVPRGPWFSLLVDDDGLLLGGAEGLGQIHPAGRVESWAPGGLPGRVDVLALHRSRALWVGTTEGLFKVETGRAVRVGGRDRVLALASDGEGRVWTCGLRRVGFVDGSTLIEVPWPGGVGNVYALTAAPDGSVLVASDRGLARGHRGRLLPVAGPPGIRALLFDRAGRLWMGGEAGLWRSETGASADRGRLVHAAPATTLFQDAEGSLWAGAGSGGLWQLVEGALTPVDRDAIAACEDPAGQLWIARANRVSGPAGSDDVPAGVTTLLCADDGTVFAGTKSGVLRWRAGERGAAIAGLQGDVRSLYAVGGTLWAGTRTGSVFRLRGGRLDTFGPQHGLPGNGVHAFAQDAAGVLWVGTSGGLVRFDGARFVTASRPPLDRAVVRALAPRSSGGLWVGTAGATAGLFALDERGVTRVVPSGDVAEAAVFSLLPEGNHVWAVLDRAVVRLAPGGPDDVIPARAIRHVLGGARFVGAPRAASITRRRDGSILVASEHGLLLLDPRSLGANTLGPQVRVRGTLVDGVEVHGPVRLASGGVLEIRFEAISLQAPRGLRFLHRLRGQAWARTAERSVRLAALAPGEHAFEVIAENGDGVRGPPASLAITVPRPLHQRPSIWISALAALTAIGWRLHRSRLEQLRRQHATVTAERVRLSRELHDSVLQSLGMVTLQIETALARLPHAPERAEKALQQALQASSQTLDDARALASDLRSAGSFDLRTALSAAAERLRGPSNAAVRLTVEGDLQRLSPAVKSEVFCIGQEAMGNALRHAGASEIHVEILVGADELLLRVADDGAGFTVPSQGSAAPEHFGLAVIRERAARLGGSFHMDTRPGAGCRIEVRAPLPRVHSSAGVQG